MHLKHEKGFEAGFDIRENSSMVKVAPIDLLHLEQIGRRLSSSVDPPELSGTLWPHSKSNTVTRVVHQDTAHLCRNVSPQCVVHTCSRSLMGIFAFRVMCLKGPGNLYVMTTFEEFVERSSWSPGTFVKDIVRWHRDVSPKKNHVTLENTIRILESHGYVVDSTYKIQASPLSTFIQSWEFPKDRDFVTLSMIMYQYTQHIRKLVRVNHEHLEALLRARGFDVRDHIVRKYAKDIN